ncbi:hypothetical protein [Microseira sp. BLCC-F43]|jgi:virulence-associated protein VapD|uniref:hypothetical protein n=1 Tax=Microseira sp. BLCC-F43 TaxID=3153602 RepID=UPI0035BB066D
MYAIAFALDQEPLKNSYRNESYPNAYNDIKLVLAEYGFIPQQGSVYFGDRLKVNAVTCVLAVQDLTIKYSWFKAAVRDLRMLRIEDDNDLKPAINAISS